MVRRRSTPSCTVEPDVMIMKLGHAGARRAEVMRIARSPDAFEAEPADHHAHRLGRARRVHAAIKSCSTSWSS